MYILFVTTGVKSNERECGEEKKRQSNVSLHRMKYS